ncbi:MAG: cyclase family protein [Verrucomicrobia bacterium]|nr:cyclase family protein [Verrucomicrobiota bacterium]
MKSAWLDISIPVHTGMVHWPDNPVPNVFRFFKMEDGLPCNVSALFMSAHTGTHMDSPRHFIADGDGMETAPLDAILGPCRVVEIKDPEAIKAGELKKLKLRRGERVLFKTRNSAGKWWEKPFDRDFVGIWKEAAQVIVDAGVRTVGIDYLSVGPFRKDGVETHQILLGAKVWILEGLNLCQVKPGNYELICLPLKITGCDGAPARAVLRKLGKG